MKLRLEENSLRLRLSDEEVQHFAQTGRISYSLQLGPAPDQFLNYALEQLPEADPAAAPRLRYQAGQLVVEVPAAEAREWTKTKKVGFAGQIVVGAGRELRIVVEKDLGYQH